LGKGPHFGKKSRELALRPRADPEKDLNKEIWPLLMHCISGSRSGRIPPRPKIFFGIKGGPFREVIRRAGKRKILGPRSPRPISSSGLDFEKKRKKEGNWSDGASSTWFSRLFMRGLGWAGSCVPLENSRRDSRGAASLRDGSIMLGVFGQRPATKGSRRRVWVFQPACRGPNYGPTGPAGDFAGVLPAAAVR